VALVSTDDLDRAARRTVIEVPALVQLAGLGIARPLKGVSAAMNVHRAVLPG
jgi:hypothetical protein